MSYLEGPAPKNDLVRPGEQWFCYWKTSASLWENRIIQSPAHEVLFIPLYWGFHAEGPNQWDFGNLHPERDLGRLVKLLTQHGRKFCWLLPITPAPFMPNGGVPVAAARTLSISHEGVHLAALDQEDKLHKMYSFFEPKVYSAFIDFLSTFGRFLGENKIKAPLWGAAFEFMEGDKVTSYLDDYSLAFEQGFSRYLKQSYKDGVDLRDPSEEERLKKKFIKEVETLFKSSVETALSPFWQGVQTIVMLGGSPRETIERSLPTGRSPIMTIRDLFINYTHNRFISSALLRPTDKGEMLPAILKEHLGAEEVERRYHYNIPSRELNEEWRPFRLLDIFENGKSRFKNSGLLSFLEENYRWMYGIHAELNFQSEWIDEHQQTIKFFHAENMDRTRFSQMLKLFMMGQRIVFDRSGLHPDLDKRLEIFYLENNLKSQTVNFMTTTNICELGEGKFITYEGERLETPRAQEFWSHLFKYFNLNHLESKADKDVYSLWRIRGTTPHELNYLDVRRANFYNPTSYKRQVLIHTKGSFAFMKMIDPSRAKATSVPHGVEIELLPNGRIALDFGHYEEG